MGWDWEGLILGISPKLAISHCSTDSKEQNKYNLLYIILNFLSLFIKLNLWGSHIIRHNIYGA
jgi:hypothetical protein